MFIVKGFNVGGGYMSLMMKLYKSNHKLVENISIWGTGMGGNLMLDRILSDTLKHKNLSKTERREYERIQEQDREKREEKAGESNSYK